MKRAIVFGATGGIGQSICYELASNGWSLYLHCNQKFEEAKAMAAKFFKKYPDQDFIPLKLSFLSNDEQITAMINSLLPINAVIFAQGITKYGFFGEQSLADIDKIVKVNLTMPLKITRLLESTLVKQDFSRIVYLGSVYGGQGSALEAVYSSTKAGLSRFSQAYSREVASAGLTVNVIAPGAIRTPMNAIFSTETLKEVEEEIPAGRWGNGSDVAFWVKTLLDKKSNYCTGQTIYVSGGWLL